MGKTQSKPDTPEQAPLVVEKSTGFHFFESHSTHFGISFGSIMMTVLVGVTLYALYRHCLKQCHRQRNLLPTQAPSTPAAPPSAPPPPPQPSYNPWAPPPHPYGYSAMPMAPMAPMAPLAIEYFPSREVVQPKRTEVRFRDVV